MLGSRAHSDSPDFSLKLLVTFFAIFTWSCSATRHTTLDHPKTSSTLWMQNAAEYDALTMQIYESATSKLLLSLEDSFWTAAVEQEQDENYRKLPPAVILDVDETVLNNSPFEARMIKQNTSFDPQQWAQWVEEADAEAISGALEFTTYAASREVTVFYVTNRDHSGEEATLRNLKRLGFPVESGKDVLLTKNERENWGSDKTTRRDFLAEDYRILMLFGDNLNDFVSAENMSQDERDNLIQKHKDKWGRKWFMFPNPVYGSWEGALYNFDETLTEDEIMEAKAKKLNTGN